MASDERASTTIPIQGRATLAAAVAAFVLCYAALVAGMINVWSTQPLYSYGFLIPVISAYVAWLRPRSSSVLPRVPDYPLGIALIILGMLMLVVGHVGSIATLQFASLVIVLVAFVLLVFGRRTFRRYWFPLLYLFLMVPIWDVAISAFQNPSRVLSAGIATAVLDVIGVPVLRQGTNIVLPLHTLAVMRECSGVNQLVATIAMVLPAAYLWLSGNVRRLVLITLAVVITFLSNGFRIALVGWLAYAGYGDGNLLGSYTHVSEGLVVAILGYAAIAGCFSALSRWPRASPPAPTVPRPSLSTRQFAPRRRWLDVSIVVLVLAVGTWRLVATPREIPPTRDLHNMPAVIGTWRSTAGDTDRTLTGVPKELVGAYPTGPRELRFAGVDDELVRTYRTAAGDELQLYVGFYRRQEEGKELKTAASDQLRLVSSPVVLDRAATTSVGEVVGTVSGDASGILFWYDINGRISSSIYEAKAYATWDALMRRRTNGAVVMIGWRTSPGTSVDESRRRAREFAQALIPVLQQYLPT
jgi:EpsI family protein